MIPEAEVLRHQEWLRRIACGDLDAMSELYDVLSGPLFSVALRILSDVGEAEEVLQDVFQTIWTHAGDYDASRSRPFSWMLVLLRRRCWNHLRARGRRVRKLQAYAGETDGVFEQDAIPGDSVDRQEMVLRVRQALQSLPEGQRRCIELSWYQGMTQEDIAIETGIPLGTVKTWVRRGLQVLVDQVKGLT
jgi:RNA polymerase sigma-70 factor (ECF subfamily)